MKFTKYIIVGVIILLILGVFVTADILVFNQQIPDISYHDPVAREIFNAMNENRVMYNVAPLLWDNNLENASYYKAVSYIKFEIIPRSLPYDREDYMIVQSWELTQHISYPMFQVDKLSNIDRNFQLDQLNPEYHSAGVSSVRVNGWVLCGY
jgi:hypothetical protein